MNFQDEFDAGRAAQIRADAARKTADYINLRAIVLAAAVAAYKSGDLRSVGGITAVMGRAAAANDRLYAGVFGVPMSMSGLLDFQSIRLEAQRAARGVDKDREIE